MQRSCRRGDVAFLVVGDIEQARRLGADGVLLDGEGDVRRARARLGAGRHHRGLVRRLAPCRHGCGRAWCGLCGVRRRPRWRRRRPAHRDRPRALVGRALRPAVRGRCATGRCRPARAGVRGHGSTLGGRRGLAPHRRAACGSVQVGEPVSGRRTRCCRNGDEGQCQRDQARQRHRVPGQALDRGQGRPRQARQGPGLSSGRAQVPDGRDQAQPTPEHGRHRRAGAAG